MKCLLLFLVVQSCRSLTISFQVERRQAIFASIGVVSGASSAPTLTWADVDVVPYERRDRNGNKKALIREDYWYMMGKTPPRLLGSNQLKSDDPKWNAWGTCETETGNSCTYVSLKQKIPAYSKYAFSIAYGGKEYQELGKLLKTVDYSPSSEIAWDQASAYVTRNTVSSSPPPAVDALLKMILFATAVLTSPNYSGPSRELLVARFYVNEASFATRELGAAIEAKDLKRAKEAWEFGRDSWNSYLNVVNRAIVPKVGDKFILIE